MPKQSSTPPYSLEIVSIVPQCRLQLMMHHLENGELPPPGGVESIKCSMIQLL